MQNQEKKPEPVKVPRKTAFRRASELMITEAYKNEVASFTDEQISALLQKSMKG
jgi:hypothetical protein